jgi:hypothetical protein
VTAQRSLLETSRAIAMTTLLSRGNRKSRGFSGFVTFQGFAGRKIFLSLRRPPMRNDHCLAEAGDLQLH